MRIFYATLVLAWPLVASGCQNNDPKPEQTQQTAASTPSESSHEQSHAEQPDEMTSNAKSQLAAAIDDVNTKDTPDHLKEMIKQVEKIHHIIKQNENDCKKITEEVQQYLSANAETLQQLAETTKSERAKLNQQDRLKEAQQVATLFRPIVEDSIRIQAEFANRCPSEAQQVAKALSQIFDAKNTGSQ